LPRGKNQICSAQSLGNKIFTPAESAAQKFICPSVGLVAEKVCLGVAHNSQAFRHERIHKIAHMLLFRLLLFAMAGVH
jgi:hypothetical protein